MNTAALAAAQPGEESPYRRSGYAGSKRLLDVGLALAGLVLAGPVVAVAALLIKLTSRGPVFYTQVRLGLGGRPFRIYKLRTMHPDSEALTGPCWSVRGDPRVTRVGRFLRWSHIDELPQVWNILTGDMSLIGPRPERPEMVPGLERSIPRYRERLRIRPGLTGLAQVQLPPDSDLGSVRVKLAHDLCYLEHRSFWLDSRIFVATILHVCGMPYDLTRRLCVLPGGRDVAERYESGAERAGVVADLQAV